VTSEGKNLSDIDRPMFLFVAARCEVPLSALVTAAAIGTALLALAIWIELRATPGDGNYRNSGPPRS
jgi:hypothetical protein